jgi:hypothetical protein
MTAALTDLRELARPTPAFATFQHRFVRLDELTARIAKIAPSQKLHGTPSPMPLHSLPF